jgi:hypothetical protein
MLKSTSLPILAGVAALGAVALIAPPASADIITSSLTVSDGTLGPGPFGTVQINRTSSTMAMITYTTASGFTFGDGSAIDANVNAASFSVSGATANCTSCTLTVVNPPGTSNVDGLGTFNLTTTVGNFSPTSDFTVGSFTVTDLSGTWASASQVLAFNSGGGNCPLGCDAGAHARNETSGNTAFVGETVPAPVIGHGLFVLLAVGGVLFGGKLFESLKMRRSLAD